MNQKKRLIKRLLGILLSLTVVMGLMPGTKITVKAASYNLYVGGTQVTDDNKTDIPVANGTKEGTASYDPGTNTLTLTNYKYEGKGTSTSDGESYGIYNVISNATLTINLVGENSITMTSASKGRCIRSYYNTQLNFTGTGSLSLVNSATNDTYGIESFGPIRVTSGKINANVGMTAIRAINGIEISGGELNLSGLMTLITNGTTTLSITGGNVIMVGSYTATDCKVFNSIPGIGWDNVGGTGTGTPIPISTSGQTFSYKRVKFPAHDHDFTYAGSNASITATCANTDGNCSLDDHKSTLTIVAPVRTTYGGTESASATLDGLSAFNSATGKTISTSDISYYQATKSGTTYTKTGSALASAPTDAGDYVAELVITGVKTAESTSGSVTAAVGYTIAKADPIATAPSASATYGQTLADVTLTNPTGNTPGTWTWVDAGTTSVGDAGYHFFKANFTPTDTNNYNSKNDVSVRVSVGKVANPATVNGTAAVTKGGNTVDLSDNITLNGATGNVTYEISGDAKGCSLNGSVLTSGDVLDTVTVNVSIAADNNYEALAATPITVTIADKGTQTITASDVTATYGDTDKSISATTSGDGAISYAVKNGSEDYIDVNASTGALTIKKVPADGKAYVTVTAAETQTYVQATKDVTVTISKANAVPATVAANNRVYDGTDKPLVTVTGETTGGTLKYVAGTDSTTEPADGWSESMLTATDIGTYYVWYKAFGDENHTDSVARAIEVTISAEEPSDTDPVISIGDLPDAIDGESYNYTLTASGAQPITWSITAGALPDGLSLESDTGKISGTPTSTGTSTFTVTATNTYGSASKEMSITVQAGSTIVDKDGSAPDDQKTEVESEPSVVRDIVGDAAGGVTESDTVRLILTTDSRDEGSVTGEEKEAVDAIKGAAEGSGLVVGTFVDLTLSYEVKNANGEITSSGQISQTARPLTVKFPIPAGLQKAGRLFKIFRYHGSNVTELGSGSGDAVDVSTDLFSIYAIAYTDDAAPDVPEGEESSEQPHVHTFAWDTRNATADTDGEMRYQCTKCGMIQTRVPISAYYIFNKETTEKIRAAKQGETVKIETRRWISFHKMVAEALAERKDVTVEVSFLDQGHKGNPYTFTIPAGTDLTPLFDESGFAGFMYLGNKFGMTAEGN